MNQDETLNVMAEATPDGKPRPAANSNQRRTTMDVFADITPDGQMPTTTTDVVRAAVATAWHSYRRRTVEDAWKLGVALRRVRQAAFHGEWLPWLASIDMSHDTAKRMMKLAKEYPQIVQIALFESVDSALKALPKPEPKPEGEVPAPRTAQTDADTKRAREAQQAQEDLEAEAEAMEAEEMERLREQEHREGREAIVKLQQLTGPNGQTGLAGAMETIVHKSKEIKALRGELKDVSDKLRKRESFINRIKENLLKDGNGDRVLREAWGLKRR